MTPSEMQHEIKATDRMLKQNSSKSHTLKKDRSVAESRIKSLLEEIRRDDFLIPRTHRKNEWLSIEDYDVEQKIQMLRDGYLLEAGDECDIYFTKTSAVVETEDEKQHLVTRVFDNLQNSETEHASLSAQIQTLEKEHLELSKKVETLRQNLKNYYKVTFGKK